MKKYLVFICLAFINFKLTPMQKVQDKKVDVFLKIKSNSKEKIDLKELNNCINEMLKNKDPRLEKQMLKVFHEKYFGSKDILIQALEEGLSNLAQKGYSATIKDTCYSLINKIKNEYNAIAESPYENTSKRICAFGQGALERGKEYCNIGKFGKDCLIGMGKLLCIIRGDDKVTRDLLKKLKSISDKEYSEPICSDQFLIKFYRNSSL